MEQARYWMWSKPAQSFYGDSWEEQAFAVDAAAGSLGGCVWPPRSYTCSFCRREFRSAQALGGHMNVHRRDRARLKQSQNPLDHDQVLHQNHLVDHSTPLDFQFSHQVCNPNPNSNSSQFMVHEKSSFPLFSSPTVEDLQDNSSNISIPVRSNLVAQTNFLHDLLNQNSDGEKIILSGLENNSTGEKDSYKADLSTSLNLSIRRKRSWEDERSENISSKKHKVESTSLGSFSKTNSSDRFEVQSEVLELSSSSIEDLDLELNLGIGHKKSI